MDEMHFASTLVNNRFASYSCTLASSNKIRKSMPSTASYVSLCSSLFIAPCEITFLSLFYFYDCPLSCLCASTKSVCNRKSGNDRNKKKKVKLV